ncbi:sel1 repeat family protein [Pseudomonas sp. UL073]|uniref:Sel1 repeat family protein n=1 Tax=Zestomonas insulae TaxID=2809017 RepID=A0ABS2I9G8_9GAMM|nr:tetratricopeptide repeat protein [Pseudomonas insulae]MBM7059781.1 sel1 repeat family protein [Pseudomonas insulae]
MTTLRKRDEILTADELRQRLADDPRQAARVIVSAAGEGLPEAQLLLGQILLDGRGIERDPSLARRWFGIAAASGDAMACNMLGRCLEHGWGGAVDSPAAAQQYRRAAAAGLDWAMYNLAGLLARGHGVEEDQQAAFAWYLRAAELGHAKAMNLVGRYYEEGLAVERDARVAVDWYRRSAEAGDFRGQFSYASVLAQQGQVAEAVTWLEQALAGGNLNFLRVCRSGLLAAPQAEIRALAPAYYARAAELGDDTDRLAQSELLR